MPRDVPMTPADEWAELPDDVLLEASILTTAELIEADEDDYWKRRTLDAIERVRADPTGEEAMKGIRPVRALLRNIKLIEAARQQPAADGGEYRQALRDFNRMRDDGSLPPTQSEGEPS